MGQVRSWMDFEKGEWCMHRNDCLECHSTFSWQLPIYDIRFLNNGWSFNDQEFKDDSYRPANNNRPFHDNRKNNSMNYSLTFIGLKSFHFCQPLQFRNFSGSSVGLVHILSCHVLEALRSAKSFNSSFS